MKKKLKKIIGAGIIVGAIIGGANINSKTPPQEIIRKIENKEKVKTGKNHKEFKDALIEYNSIIKEDKNFGKNFNQEINNKLKQKYEQRKLKKNN